MDKLSRENLIELVESAQKGNKNSFSRLYKYYITPIFRFIYFRVRSRVDAEDLTQIVFLKTWNYLPGYKQGKDSFSAWLYAIARNTIIDFWRKKKEWSIGDLAENIIKEDKKPIDDSIDEEKDLELIKKLMEFLTEEQEEVMILKYVEGFSNKEIAKIIRKKEDAVRQIQSRAIKTLKEYLK